VSTALYLDLVSQTRPSPLHSADHFQYAARGGEASGDLGPLYMNIWNAIIELVTCKAFIGNTR